jgi:hypothetical protein
MAVFMAKWMVLLAIAPPSVTCRVAGHRKTSDLGVIHDGGMMGQAGTPDTRTT